MSASMKMRLSHILRLVLFGLITHSCYVQAKSKHVAISLDAKWSSTPLLLEASEFLAQESSDYFWTFVQDISNLNPNGLHGETDQSIYNTILKYASRVLSPVQMNLLKFSLSLRMYSPTVQMFQQIAEDDDVPEKCGSFISVHGEITCDPHKLSSLVQTAKDRPKPAVYKFDHFFPGAVSDDVIVILYAELGTASFTQFHATLAKMTGNKEITYILRHFIQNPSPKKARLSGYGIELAIKSTEYKAKDDTKVEGEGTEGFHSDSTEEDIQGFVFAKLREIHPDKKNDLKDFRNHLIDSTTELPTLKVWQLQDLSIQAGQRVISAPPDDALRVLRDISQNFPTQARSLVRVKVDNDFKMEMERNQQMFENNHGVMPGESALFVNGLQINMDVYDIFALIEAMKSEAKILEGLHSLGFKGDDVPKLLSIDLKGSDDTKYALDIRHTAVQFVNDLENDKKYMGWPNSLQDFLRPTFPGMLRHIRKNIFHLIFIVNPAEKQSRELIRMAEAFLVHKAPIRLGLVLAVNSNESEDEKSEAGEAFAKAFNFIKVDESAAKALSFITDVYEKYDDDVLTAESVKAEFKNQYPGEDLNIVFGKESDYDDVMKAGSDYISQSGLDNLPQVLMNGIPLKKKFLSQDLFEEGVVSEILAATTDIQQAVYKGHLHDGLTVLDWLMERDNVLPRLSSRVLSPSKITLDITENIDDEILHDPDTFSHLPARDKTSVIAGNLKYLARKEEETLHPVTMWVVADLDSVEGRQHMYNAIKQLKHSGDMRLSVVFNPVSSDGENKINKAVNAALNVLVGNNARNFITKLVKEETVEELKSGEKTMEDLAVHGMDIKAYLSALEKQSDKFLQSHQVFAQQVLGFQPGDRGVVTNGKVLGPLRDGENFTTDDFALLEKFIYSQFAKKISDQIKTLGHKGTKGSELSLKVGALLTAKSQSESRKKVIFGSDKHSVVKIPADETAPAFFIEAIVDPVSRDAQKLASLLEVLREVTNVEIKLYLNSKDKLSEMPLKSFYRCVLEPEVNFNDDGSYTSGPYARFNDLPQKTLLTVIMEPPESWLVQAVRSPYDLDNILLEEVDVAVTAEFELEYILLEGHCYDANSMQPPRGLQFTLGTNRSDTLMDTIVMANLGYFQLKANPGVWLLKLREGRSLEIYDIESHEFTDTPPGSNDLVVAIGGFKSKIIRVKVAKKSDKQGEQLLQDGDDSPGLWDSLSSSITGSVTDGDQDNTLNIFSLASGHLYERLLRIMMLSVLKQTKSKVKFWFLKNYLSPTFKDFIPYMAKEHGFEYELVQYKWPRWLNQQKEKQRVIWGYKILFLDVLFPLDVKKIIFVDADQIVRADLQELHDLDLGGAPYGYTPFCSSRKEMDGFRFWKSGYWASHLAGRKYHISALYVVDLKRFRRVAAGDRLRGQYQGLSQDPNSLSNLDQDLPNNMIHQVAIKSLPQEWLWCETWCSDEEKTVAKTIDLCNNPLTKEPKLKAAMRIVPEWKEYDYKIKVLWDKIYGTNTRLQTEYDPSTFEDSSSEKDKSEKEEL
ncbi:UDP-glucose:glycoprotein glucosyltransferase 1-like [Gigantopelta aegis]|uniref:UDP-glucose:glycoprotein glucosyltransferase 1-like n=1 Tax=Gigantopelta aegis TaxID=1735272 RepID=UPI001B88C8F7|nr:UDP-glucose:glycoprotein glucosyltransferase 1-like [Gigantopelta aegis]